MKKIILYLSGSFLILLSFVFLVLSFFSVPFSRAAASQPDLKSKQMHNPAAYIVSQCYTKTFDSKRTYNPCYSCHTTAQEPNYMSDADLQESYSFPQYATENHWKNLFKDRSKQVAAISDQEIENYILKSNYIEGDKILLAERLRQLPSAWDFNNNGKWDGYVPDCYFSFDEEGFDRTPQNGYSGWRAFAYYPFLGTFWPTNGSTDDVLIRLAQVFRKNKEGNFDKEVYMLNLAVSESLVKEKDASIKSVDEKKYGVDFNRNGKLDQAHKVVFAQNMSYTGLAGELQAQGKIAVAAGLFPQGTEFLHSVRYIDAKDNNIALAPRMKELRYAQKFAWLSYADLAQRSQSEIKEKFEDRDAPAYYKGNMETGILNQTGWVYQGFIEDANGELRPQNYEEQVFCIGCHGNIGATTDTIFSFARKFSSEQSFRQGWYHWSQKGLQNVDEPLRQDGKPEYAFYLLQNQGGDEFRANREVYEKFFDAQGNARKQQFARLKKDISYLLFPSRERALLLNKAYRVIVKEQSFIDGRDAVVRPVKNVHRQMKQDTPTRVSVVEENFYP